MERQVLGKLIAGQLLHFKYDDAAQLVAEKFNLLSLPPPSNKLAELIDGYFLLMN